MFYWFGMVRRKLTIPERWQSVGMHSGGLSHRRVADHFRVNHSIIVRLLQRFRQTGNVTDRPRAGRPRKTTPGEDRLSYPDGRGNGRSVQLVHFVVI
jgi:IS30 family transposase